MLALPLTHAEGPSDVSSQGDVVTRCELATATSMLCWHIAATDFVHDVLAGCKSDAEVQEDYNKDS